MRKFILTAVLAAVALPIGISEARAECAVVGQGPTGDLTCTYAASGTGIWAAATPNDYEVYAMRDDDGLPNTPRIKVELVKSEDPAPPNGGALASIAGDEIHVVMKRGCAPSEPFCGTVGLLTAGNDS